MKKKLLTVLSSLLFAGSISAQTVLISPTGDGGFENGTTFAANGWTSVNYAATTNSNWYLTPTPVNNGSYSFAPSGANAAYVSNNNGANWRYNTSAVAGSAHIYRNVTFPAGETNIKLSFRWNTSGEVTEWDVLYVYLAPTTRTPVTGTPSSNSSDVSAWTGTGTSTLVGIYYQLAAGTGTTTTVNLPPGVAGTTQKLVFTWKNDGGGGSEPPAALDDISLTSSSCGLVPTALNSTTITPSAANFTWTPGAAETVWDIYRGTQPLTAPTATTVPTTTTSVASYSMSGLPPTTAYAIYVRANCGGGVYSNWTAVKNFTTLATCPAPTTPTVTNITGYSARATWTVGAAETAWDVYYGTQPLTAPTATTVPTVTVSGTPSYTLATLTPATGYALYVRANCGPGDVSLWTAVRNFTTTVSCPAPTTPTVTNITGNSARATWTVGAGETAWDLYRGPQPLTAPTATTVPTATVSGTPSYTMTGLNPTTGYAVYVRANCGPGDVSLWTAVRNFTTTVSCPAPSNLTLSAATPTSAVATWTNNGPATSWILRYAPPTTTVSVPGTPSYTMTGLTPSTNYSVQVRGFCGVGDTSTWTSNVVIMTQCLPPNITSTTPATRCGVGTATLGVNGDPGALFQWYTASSGGSAVATGSVYTTPVISSSTNFFVSAANVISGARTFGAGASTGTGVAYNLTQGGYGGLKGQYLYTAAELRAAGLTAGNITSMSFEVTSVGATLQGFAVQVGPTALTDFPATISILGGLNTVYPAATFVPVLGVNTINFTTPYNWDGVSNIVVSTSWSNNNTSNTSSTIKYDATTNYASQTYREDSKTAANMFAFTGSTGGPGTNTFDRSQNRPMMRFVGSVLCEGTRTLVPATVNSAAAVTVSTPTTVCMNVVSTVSVTSTLSNYDSYIWSPATNLYTDAAATIAYAGGTATVLYYKSATAGTTTYSVNASNSVSGCANVTSTSMTTDIPVVNASATPSMICSGAAVTLSATTNIIGTGNVTIGTGTSLIAPTAQPTAFCNRWVSYRMQTVYTAAELTAAGLSAGNITAISYSTSTQGDAATNPNFTVKCGTTTATSFTGFVANAGYTTVYTPAVYTHSIGLNTITFNTPFNWDGVSNIVVELAHDGANGTNNAQTYYTSTAGNTVVWAYNGNTGTTTTERLNIIFRGQTTVQAAGALTWQWNPGAVNSNTTTVNPVNTGTNVTTSSYTITGTNSGTGCAGTAVVTVTVNPIPSVPTAANSSQCGLGVPTASVGGGTSYKWYATPTSTTVLQSGASATFTTQINATTTWYVTSFNGNCESTRAMLTASVTAPDAVTAMSTSTAVCPGGSFTLSAVQSGTFNAYSYTWTASPAAGSGIATSVTGATTAVTPAVFGTYNYLVTAFDGVCTTTASINVSSNPLPNISNPMATPTVVCSAGSVTLSAISINALPGAATVGTNSLTDYTGGPYRQGAGTDNKAQWLFTAADLIAAGITQGNITAIAFNVPAGSTDVMNNFTVKMGATATTAITTNYDAAPPVVFGPAAVIAATGINTYTFATPFNWNGTSNVIIEVCHDLVPGGAGSTSVTRQATTNTTAFTNATGACASTAGTAVAYRPVITFSAQVGTNVTGSTNFVWNPGAIPTNTAVVSPINTGTNVATVVYTVTATNPVSGCSNTATTSVVVNPVPVVPTVANSTQCGVGIPTASVSGGINYKWYATPTSTTVLQAGTSPTFTATIGSTATFYVSSYSANCESGRATLTASVTTPDAITAAATSTAVCPGQSFTLTATSSGTNNVYSYTWAANPATGSGIATSITSATANVTPVTPGSYSYMLTGYDGICTATTAITVMLSTPPQIIATASPSMACLGSTVNLNAMTGTIATGTVGIGVSTLTLSAFGDAGNPYNHWYGGQKEQYIFTAAELTAAGLTSGNITAVSFDVVTATTLSMANFSMTAGHTTQGSATQNLITTGLNTVYFNASQNVTAGINNYVFSTPFNWNGTDNMVVSLSWSNVNSGSTALTASVRAHNAGFDATGYLYADNTPAAAIAAATNSLSAGVGTTSQNNITSNRPNMIFVGQRLTSGAAGLSWQWNPGAVNSNTNSVVPATTGMSSYTVTANDPATTCSNTAVVTVTVNAIPSVTVAASTGSICSGTTASLTATGATTYSWMPAGGTSSVAVVSPSSATVYTVTGTSLGCSSTKTVNLNVTPSPTVVASVSPNVICAGATVSLTASGATTYTWMPNGSTSGTTTATPTVSTTYSVMGTTAGCTNTKTLSVTVNNIPTLTVTTNPASGVLCTAGATATLTAVGTSTSYVWSSGPVTASISVAPSATTVYTVIGTNSCGTKTTTTSITVATTPTIAAMSSATVSCPGNPAVLTASATPGVTFSWNTGAGTASITVTPTTTITYTVTGTNACGTATATVVQNVIPCTGIETLTIAGDISIYPNPASDYVSIAVPANLVSANTSVELTDALGKLVMKETINTDVTTLRITELKDGVYFLKVISNNQTVKVGKVVKH
jgi:hypothetical protein